MALKLVLGPANSAKAGEVLGAYAATARRGALLVLPTATDARHYVRELAGDGVVLASVLTFSGLIAEIARRACYGDRVLTELQRERVLARVVARADAHVLRESAGTPGFVAAAGALISELQRSLVTPKRFGAGLRAWSAQDTRRAPYARELGRLYADYMRELDRLGRVDRDLYAWRALDALRAAPTAWSRQGVTPVFLYGFDDLTPLERDAVETLARVAGAEVTVSLTYEAGRDALAARAETVEELRPLADEVLELPAQDEYYADASRTALHHLERHLFTGDSVPRIDPGAAIVLLEAGGERAEAELVAHQVLQLLRAGVPGSEIAVVHRARAHAAPLLARVFADYGIALATGHATPLTHSPLGRALLGAARCALATERPATLADLLAYLRAPGVLRTRELADGLEADARRAGLGTAAQARALLSWPLTDLDQLASAPGQAAVLGRLAQRLFVAPHRAAAPVLTAEQELDARALRAVRTALDELAELQLAPRGEGLVELLERLVVEPAPDGGGDSLDAVLLAEPLEVRARRFRAILVCGLQEGEFPLASSPEPFLSDERRRELAAVGVRLRPREDPVAAERHLFYACVSRATERVVLSYRSCDEEGNLALPSPFVADVAALLEPRWSQGRRRRLLADVVWDRETAPTERERARAAAAAGGSRGTVAATPDGPHRAASAVATPDGPPGAASPDGPPGAATPDGQRRRPRLGARALGRVRHSRILSAGALETYGDCPVKWLVESELRPQPLAPDAEPLVRGSLMHDLLERLLAALGEPLTPATLARATALLDDLLAERAQAAAALAPGAPDVVGRGELRAVEAALRRYLQHEARRGPGWRVDGLEVDFGFDPGPDGDERPSLPALELGAGEDRVLVRGKIDRIDTDGRGNAIVRDYKSGAQRREWSAARWSADRRLQVAIYMLVVRELTALAPVAGLYQPLRGEDLRARGAFVKGLDLGSGVQGNDAVSVDELDALLDDAAERAVALAARLRAGDLTPCPQTCTRDGCAHPAICRSQ